MPISDQARAQMREIAARYPSARSALLPMLHLAQSEEDAITTDGINACAEVLGITPGRGDRGRDFSTRCTSVSGSANTTSVCASTRCAGFSGEMRCGMPWSTPPVHRTTPRRPMVSSSSSGSSVRRRAPHAPVMTVDWEFMDDVTTGQRG